MQTTTINTISNTISKPSKHYNANRLEEYRTLITNLKTSCTTQDIQHILELPFIRHLIARNGNTNARHDSFNNHIDGKRIVKHFQSLHSDNSDTTPTNHGSTYNSLSNNIMHDRQANDDNTDGNDFRRTRYNLSATKNSLAHYEVPPHITSNSQPSTKTAMRITSVHPQRSLASNPSMPHSCRLGNYTYSIGERWNPVLPPFGLQVCVQCDCIAVQKKTCFELRTTCKRISSECPQLSSCPNGQKPVAIDGQCCKSCQSNSQSSSESSKIEQQQQLSGFALKIPTEPSQASSEIESLTFTEELAAKNLRASQYSDLMRRLQPCPMHGVARKMSHPLT